MLIIAIGICAGWFARANCSVYLLPIVYLTVNQTTIGKWNCIISRQQVLVMITTKPLHISSLLTPCLLKICSVKMILGSRVWLEGGEGKNHENIKLPLPIFVGIWLDKFQTWKILHFSFLQNMDNSILCWISVCYWGGKPKMTTFPINGTFLSVLSVAACGKWHYLIQFITTHAHIADRFYIWNENLDQLNAAWWWNINRTYYNVIESQNVTFYN